MFIKEFCLTIVLISATSALPTVADTAYPVPPLQEVQAQPRTFGWLFGNGGGSTSYRFPSDTYRGYGYSGAGYGNGYGGASGYPSQVVSGYGGTGGYGGYGWRGSSDNRGYGQSGWANGGQSGWAQNYGR